MPLAPVFPCMPVFPCIPVAPVFPCIPVAPVSPFIPVAPVSPCIPVVPVFPCAPVNPVEPVLPLFNKENTGPVTPPPLTLVSCITRSLIILPFGPSGPVADICHPPAAPAVEKGSIGGPTFIYGVANPNSLYKTPSKFEPSVASMFDPGGPAILIVPGPTKSSFHLRPVEPKE